MFYQETDSCHMLFNDVYSLLELFQRNYDRELIGNNLGQFNFDFISIDCTDRFAVKSIFCGKKVYFDMLSNENELFAY
jgi:hypothetical protein